MHAMAVTVMKKANHSVVDKPIFATAENVKSGNQLPRTPPAVPEESTSSYFDPTKERTEVDQTKETKVAMPPHAVSKIHKSSMVSVGKQIQAKFWRWISN